jgi:hypothetical protein
MDDTGQPCERTVRADVAAAGVPWVGPLGTPVCAEQRRAGGGWPDRHGPAQQPGGAPASQPPQGAAVSQPQRLGHLLAVAENGASRQSRKRFPKVLNPPTYVAT